MICQEALEIIKFYEGFSEKAYLCPAGFKTIGYGHKILPHDNLPKIVTQDLAEKILKWDLRTTVKSVNRLIRVPLSDEQFGSVCSFTFNLGSGTLQRSTLRAKINAKMSREAADEFLKFRYAGGIILNGLIKRRKAERELFLKNSPHF